MSQMTWKEFKDRVEARGVTDDMVVNYIDVSLHYDDDVEVHMELDNSFCVLD